MKKISYTLKEYFRALLPYLLSFLLLSMVRVAIFGAFAVAQTTPPLKCPSADAVRSFVSTLQSLLFVVILVIVIFILVFNMFGFVSTLAMRLGEFFNERVRFVFELLLIYVFFLWGFDTQNMIDQTPEGCAEIKYEALFSNGPLFFRLVGWLLYMLGLWQPQS